MANIVTNGHIKGAKGAGESGWLGGWAQRGVYHMGRKIGPRRERDGMSRRSLPVCVCSHTQRVGIKKFPLHRRGAILIIA